MGVKKFLKRKSFQQDGLMRDEVRLQSYDIWLSVSGK